MADQLTYEQMLDLVARWYNTDAQNIVDALNKYNVPYGDIEQLYGLIEDTPYGAIYNSDGSIRSSVYRYVADLPTSKSYQTAKNINSNVQVMEKTEFNMPLESEVAKESGNVSFSSGLKAVGTGAKSALNFTFKEVVPAVAAASAGITVGKTIDKALYKLNPDFWDEKGMSSLNPDTWNSITSGDDSTGARLFNMVFGINPDDGTSQSYMDENALAYLTLYMQNNGVFNSSEATTEQTINGYTFPEGMSRYSGVCSTPYESSGVTYYSDGVYETVNNEPKMFYTTNDYKDSKIKYAFIKFSDKNTWKCIVAADENDVKPNTTIFGYKWAAYLGASHSIGNHNFYWATSSERSTVPNGKIYDLGIASNQFNKYNELAYLLLYGTTIKESDIDGIGTQPNATLPDLSGATTTDDVLNKLKEQYPELWDNAVSQDVVQPDGTTKHYVYVPVGFPSTTGATDTQPTTGSQTQNNTKIDPKTDPHTLPEDLVKTLTRILPPTNTPNPPDTGTGNTPPVPPVTGSASSLYAIYNPTIAELNSFGAWLWSDNFIEQIKKLFNDPMQAIIGLHKVYATPSTGGTQNIKVGYLDSGVPSKIVADQYTTINCGTIRLSEQFNNVFDYNPYTQVQLYLPFIGIVGLDVADVMRSSINIIYHVDVLSGACLAEVKIVRDNSGGTLYQYAGNASVTLPISSGSYMGIVASIASIAGGVAGTIASGGAAMPMLFGAAGSALNARTKVEHSGSFSGNAGAMGSKIPYLIISRPQTALAKNFPNYVGYPSNSTVTLSSCNGFTKVKEIHLENIPATNNELTDIETKLKSGVII